jgi:diguanylate cyclase (GGDEF)-like protein
MFKKEAESSHRNTSAVDNSSTVWVNEIELNSEMLRDTARRVGLGNKGTVRLSLDSVDRRRIQIWALAIALLFLVCLTMLLVSGVWEIELPAWLPKAYLIAFIFTLTILFGFYVFEKETQLRRLTRFLVDEQFHNDVVNRRLKVVETLLESSKAVNQGIEEHRSLDIISRQAALFFEDGEICLYRQRGEGEITPLFGEVNLGLEELARAVINRGQSQFRRADENSQMHSFGVPVRIRKRVYGALCLKTASSGIDSFETLMALSLFAEQAGAAIVNARVREREKLDESRREYDQAHDSQTGLLTREEFISRLDERITAYGDAAPQVALMFINIDDLQRINNSLGYAVGDAVIRNYCDQLHDNLPSNAMAGHFGGDEFMVAMFDVTGYESAEGLAESIATKVGESLTIGSRKIWYTASIGIAMPETYEANARDLIRDGHIAMQKAKTDGGGQLARFDANLLEDADRELNLEEDIRRALEDDEIEITLQPIFDLVSMKVVAAEALVRWLHPEHGVLPAGSFLPFASRTGQARQIDQRVFQKACLTVPRLRERGLDIPIHVNLFPGYVAAADLVESMEKILNDASIEPDCFVIEITGSDKIMSSAQVDRNLVRLKKLGFRIALDDFGSGASGLESLNKTRIDIIKVSRGFISSLNENEGSRRELVETIFSLAERLELEVIAVGVENDHQLEILKELGCERAQGFFLSKPMQTDTFLERFGDSKSEREPAVDAHPEQLNYELDHVLDHKP